MIKITKISVTSHDLETGFGLIVNTDTGQRFAVPGKYPIEPADLPELLWHLGRQLRDRIAAIPQEADDFLANKTACDRDDGECEACQ